MSHRYTGPDFAFPVRGQASGTTGLVGGGHSPAPPTPSPPGLQPHRQAPLHHLRTAGARVQLPDQRLHDHTFLAAPYRVVGLRLDRCLVGDAISARRVELAGGPADLRCRHGVMTHMALYPRTAGRPVAATSGCGRRLADGRGTPVHTPGPGTVRGGKGQGRVMGRANSRQSPVHMAGDSH